MSWLSIFHWWLGDRDRCNEIPIISHIQTIQDLYVLMAGQALKNLEYIPIVIL